MPDMDDTDAQARHIQRDIERTREEMDHTLTELERRLAPSEILHSGAETVREGARRGATSTVETLKRHPVAIGLAAALVGARIAFRPSAAERRRRRAEHDLERAFAVLGSAFERATERSQLGATKLAELGRDAMAHPGRYASRALRAAEWLGRQTRERTVPLVQRAADESRAMTQALRRDAGTYPLGALVMLGVAAGVATLGTRGFRAWR
jgi:hypothetical protein